ncbi:MAG: hypothetical protein N5P05_004181 (plasmid) [Chroococcopsis gigantea SAG 12.99]|jgi:hypothetical protein|nr:hypothetical protein [Chroococcopsis gigantea SAG 12.99]
MLPCLSTVIFLQVAVPGLYLVLDGNNRVRKISKLECVDVTHLSEELPEDGEIIEQTSTSYLIRSTDGTYHWVNKKEWDERV